MASGNASKRTLAKSKVGGHKNVAKGKLPGVRNRAVLDNDPRPLHGLGESAMIDLERRVGVSYVEMHRQYIQSIGAEWIRSVSSPYVKGDTPEEKIAHIVGDMMRFLAEFKTTLDVIKSYNMDGMSRAKVYEWKSNHKFFSDLWDQINEERFDKAERALFERSVEGVEEPIIGNGTIVGHRTKYSDDLLKFLLSGNRSMIYKKAEEKVRQQLDVEMKLKGSIGIEGLDLKRLSQSELDQLHVLLTKAQENAQ